MLTRRQFGLGLGAAAGGALIIRDLRDARGAEPIVVKLGSSLGLYELPNAGWMCGFHEKLGELLQRARQRRQRLWPRHGDDHAALPRAKSGCRDCLVLRGHSAAILV